MTSASLDQIAGAGNYRALVGFFPPRPIRSDKQLVAVQHVIERLMSVRSPTKDQLDFLELLSTLAEEYEERAHPTPSVALPDLLRHLMEARGTTQAEIARQTGVPASTLSDVVAGRRGLSAVNIAKLARHFGVDASLLLDAMVDAKA